MVCLDVDFCIDESLKTEARWEDIFSGNFDNPALPKCQHGTNGWWQVLGMAISEPNTQK